MLKGIHELHSAAEPQPKAISKRGSTVLPYRTAHGAF